MQTIIDNGVLKGRGIFVADQNVRVRSATDFSIVQTRVMACIWRRFHEERRAKRKSGR
jgi:hypothetical protein